MQAATKAKGGNRFRQNEDIFSGVRVYVKHRQEKGMSNGLMSEKG
ncbi:MAG: hypothetical protein AB1861_17065 [Cyanobacteriota bacterium]